MRKSEEEHSDVQALDTEYPNRMFSLVFWTTIIPGTSHKLRSFWAGPYKVMKNIAPALAKIKPAYYPGEEKLVSLDMLKLYWGEDVVQKNPED